MPPLSLPSRRLFVSFAVLFVVSQLLGLVCWSLVPRIAPLLLDQVGCSATAMGWILGTLPQAFTLVITPIISILSDRTPPGRFGRRIPYIWGSAIVLCMCLIQIGEFCFSHSLLVSALLQFALVSVIPTTLFYLLIPDVLPTKFIGRFTAWNGMGSSLCAAAFNTWGLDWSTNHIRAVMYLAAALFLIAVGTLVFLREMPPDANASTTPTRTPLRKTLAVCLKNKNHLGIFLSMGLNQASMILRTLFGILFVTKTLELTVKQCGQISGICALVGAISALAVGHWVDKSRPVKVYLIGSVAVAAISILGFFGAQGLYSYAVIALLTTIFYSIQSTAYMPLLVKLFPREHFGLLYSANATVCSLMVMAGSSLGGFLTEQLSYRFIFLWDFLLTTLATICMVLVCRHATAENPPQPPQ